MVEQLQKKWQQHHESKFRLQRNKKIMTTGSLGADMQYKRESSSIETDLRVSGVLDEKILKIRHFERIHLLCTDISLSAA